MNYCTYVAKNQGLMLLLLAASFCLVQSCKKDSEVDPGYGPNGEPRILSVKIPDIPDQNILLDQATKQITVTVPTSYSAATIQPTLTMTPSTTTLSGYPYSLYAIDDASQYPISVLTTGNKVTTYSLVLKPAGALTFGTPSGPQTYSISDQTVYAEFPVYNYVDGTGYRNSQVILVNRTSGERIVPSVVLTGRNGLVDRKPRTDGAVLLTLYLNGSEIYYTPGDYSVELAKPNGRTATLTQPIQLLKGPTSARFDANYTLRLNAGEYLLYGSNFTAPTR